MHNLTFTEFHNALLQNNYIVSPTESIGYYSTTISDTNKGAILYGLSGTGKTYFPETLAKFIPDAKLFFIQCFPNTREEDLMIKMLPSENTKSGIAMTDGVIKQALLNCKNGGKSILLIDEWDKTRPSADSFLLDFLNSKRITFNNDVIQLTNEEMSNLAVYLTMNDERDVSEPLLTRLPKLDFDLLKPSLVRQALINHFSNYDLATDTVINSYITIGVELYIRWIYNNISKPMSIRELIQFISVAYKLHKQIDGLDDKTLSSLIMQYLAKSRENVQALTNNDSFSIEEMLEKLNDKIDNIKTVSFSSLNSLNNVNINDKLEIADNNSLEDNSEKIKLLDIKLDHFNNKPQEYYKKIDSLDDKSSFNNDVKLATCVIEYSEPINTFFNVLFSNKYVNIINKEYSKYTGNKKLMEVREVDDRTYLLIYDELNYSEIIDLNNSNNYVNLSSFNGEMKLNYSTELEYSDIINNINLASASQQIFSNDLELVDNNNNYIYVKLASSSTSNLDTHIKIGKIKGDDGLFPIEIVFGSNITGNIITLFIAFILKYNSSENMLDDEVYQNLISNNQIAYKLPIVINNNISDANFIIKKDNNSLNLNLALDSNKLTNFAFFNFANSQVSNITINGTVLNQYNLLKSEMKELFVIENDLDGISQKPISLKDLLSYYYWLSSMLSELNTTGLYKNNQLIV